MRTSIGLAWLVVVCCLDVGSPAGPISDLAAVPLTGSEQANGMLDKPMLLGDRFQYWNDDRAGQFWAILPAVKDATPAKIQVQLAAEAQPGQVMQSAEIPAGEHRKITFLLRTIDLKPGKYLATARWLDGDGNPLGEALTYTFERTDKATASMAFPADGLPLELPPLPVNADAAWPVHAAVLLPINAVDSVDRFALFEDGKPVPSQSYSRATWGPKDASVQWAHVHFLGRFKQGKPATYQLKYLPAPAAPVASGLTSTQTDDLITVDNGFVRFTVNRKAFAGIDAAWFDPTGKGQFKPDAPTLSGKDGGPFLVDGRLIRFVPAHDKNAVVQIEEQGPAKVTIVASGWYANDEGRVDPLCQFKTRMTLHAGSPVIQVSHHTILAFDTSSLQIKELGFALPMAAESFAIGIDGKTQSGAIPEKGKGPAESVYVHQDRHDHVRLVGAAKEPVEGARSDGWFTATAPGGETSVSVLLRDVWQKFPKEVELARDAMKVHFWPAHGHRAFGFEDELSQENIYKFWSFHQHALLDLQLPTDYYDRLKTYPGMTENIPEHALNAQGQGLAIGNDFAIVFAAKPPDGEVANQAKIFQDKPMAMPPQAWNDGTLVFGNMAVADYEHFKPAEEAFEQGMLSFNRSLERGNDYGMWIYADNHTYWDVANNHAGLHRVWMNSHYHQVGTSWLMVFRTRNPQWLRWARAANDHYMNVATINYAEQVTDENGNKRAKYKFHMLGGMYHCKGCVPWGGEAYGMQRRDGHAGLMGHWIDPDAHLWNWYLDANPRAWDLYQTWAREFNASRIPIAGTRREANNTFAMVVNLYRATWDPSLLSNLHLQARSLRLDEPLDKQNPGPLWHPLWMNRYYELTRDPQYVDFILHWGDRIGLADTWAMGLGALAYELSGDKKYLEQHFERLHDLPRTMFHAPGDPYDGYGNGPGPLGFRWGEMGFGYLVKQLHKAGYTRIDPPATVANRGMYPSTPSRFDIPNTPPSIAIHAWEQTDRPFKLQFSGSSFGGDMHPVQVLVYSPSGKLLHQREIKSGASSFEYVEPIPADGESGMNRVELRMHEAGIKQPITDLDAEIVTFPAGKAIRTNRLLSHVTLAKATGAVPIAVEADKPNTPVNVTITDAAGKTILDQSLLLSRRDKFETTVDPAAHPFPWKVDAMGLIRLTFAGDADQQILISDDPKSLSEMAERLKAVPAPAAAVAK